MAHRLFEGAAHANLYAKYRPIPPPQLIQTIVTYLKEKYPGPLSLAFDVGCGSGQSTQFIAPYFTHVIGTDVSPAQVEAAIQSNKFDNVKFEVSPAEVISSAETSVQLISASQAAHWFDLPRFYKEGRRILCPNGVLALYGYEFPRFHWSKDTSKNVQLYEAQNDFYAGDLKGFWEKERKFVDARYKDFVIPYSDFIRDDTFYHDSETNVHEFIQYCRTWSGYQTYCKVNGDDKGQILIDKLQERMMKILDVETGPGATTITKRTSFFLLMARKPS